ncbi:hypothetical protein GWI33_006095 [Rhynchophorus ferrugineus]|uniref:Uncharacterized protein n=1 Tax=Rhynchophorus ferrugineus TaxID=354439 RepID=A0A834IM60_RHYFE|nr:hypothetical protein GWI33_006095 [Rhynchophorus ferrugineus]
MADVRKKKTFCCDSAHYFADVQEFEFWKEQQHFETGYAITNVLKKKGCKEIYYACNRSDISGYTPKYKKMAEKTGGTIKIKGMCPSRMICVLHDAGPVSVHYWKTHAGHETEARCLHLSVSDKNDIIDKLKSGVTVDKIIQDARETKSPKNPRVNLLKRDDVVYLIKKHNIDVVKNNNEVKKTNTTKKMEVENVEGEIESKIQFTEDKCSRVKVYRKSNIDYFIKKQNIEVINIPNERKRTNTTAKMKIENDEEIERNIDFIEEKCFKRVKMKINNENNREILLADLCNWTRSLSEHDFKQFMTKAFMEIRKIDQKNTTRKHKMEDKLYFRTTKSRKTDLF